MEGRRVSTLVMRVLHLPHMSRADVDPASDSVCLEVTIVVALHLKDAVGSSKGFRTKRRFCPKLNRQCFRLMVYISTGALPTEVSEASRKQTLGPSLG
jgi:hypothetical protein